MAQSAPLLLRIVASSVTAANRAGKIIKDVMAQGELAIVDKGRNDLQTEADRSAQRCIIASLSRQFPSVTIIGEEGLSNCEVPSDWVVTDSDPHILSLNCPEEYKDISDKEVTIWVDPLDGTSEYTQGLLDHVTVLIGVAIKDRAVGGVIHQPYYNYKTPGETGRTIWGIRGATVGGFVPHEPPQDKRIVTTTRSHSDGIVQDAVNAMEPTDVLKVGGAGHKVMLLMEGIAHAYVFASGGSKRWDTCAPEAILLALGGELTDMMGDHYSYAADTKHANSRGVLGTAKGVDHSWYLKRVPNNVKESLLSGKK